MLHCTIVYFWLGSSSLWVRWRDIFENIFHKDGGKEKWEAYCFNWRRKKQVGLYFGLF